MPTQQDVRFTFSCANDIAFDVVSFTLSEAISECFSLQIELVSDDPDIDFAQLLDLPACLTVWSHGEAVRHVHGIISRFEQGSSGQRRTRYSAEVIPQLARALLRSDWQVFQHRSVTQILDEQLQSRYRLSAEQRLTCPHQPREYCVQVGELDLDFYQRLAAEEGLLSVFRHSASAHALIYTDRIMTLGAIEGAPVLYQPNPGGDQPQPALRRFSYREQLRSSSQTQRDYSFKHPRYDQQHSVQAQGLEHHHPRYERYDAPGRYKRDEAGLPFTQTRLKALRRDARTATVMGDDARIVPGLAFTLTGHPRESLNSGWRAVSMRHEGVQHTSLEEEAAGAEVGTRYSFTAELIPDSVDWKAPLLAKPRIDGPQIAHVVGPSNEEIFCDEHGRVRLQFPWDRQGREDGHSSCWVRVAQQWAGAGWGHMAIPRVGQEVVVAFLDGDGDQPLVIGRSYHAVNRPPYKLPDFKALSPIRSKEHKGQRHNELRLDDTEGQISATLMSDHQASALHLGYLTHPRPLGGQPRGEGFELRSDGHGVVRAGAGLLLTTEPRRNACEHHTDLAETAERLGVAQQYHETFYALARDHLAQEAGDQDDVAKALHDQHQAIKGSGARTELGTPQLVMASPAGIATSTPGSIHIASGEHLALSSGGHTSLAIGKRLLVSASRGMRSFVQSLGWRLVAASGDIDIRALKDNINLLAKLKVSVTAERITLSAKEELVIQAAGSSTTYNAGGISHATSGVYSAHASDFVYQGAKSEAAAFPEELTTGKGNLQLFQRYANTHSFEGSTYRVEDALGKVFKGSLDNKGHAQIDGVAPGPASVLFGLDQTDVWTTPGFVDELNRPALADQLPVETPRLAQPLINEVVSISKVAALTTTPSFATAALSNAVPLAARTRPSPTNTVLGLLPAARSATEHSR